MGSNTSWLQLRMWIQFNAYLSTFERVHIRVKTPKPCILKIQLIEFEKNMGVYKLLRHKSGKTTREARFFFRHLGTDGFHPHRSGSRHPNNGPPKAWETDTAPPMPEAESRKFHRSHPKLIPKQSWECRHSIGIHRSSLGYQHFPLFPIVKRRRSCPSCCWTRHQHAADSSSTRHPCRVWIRDSQTRSVKGPLTIQIQIYSYTRCHLSVGLVHQFHNDHQESALIVWFQSLLDSCISLILLYAIEFVLIAKPSASECCSSKIFRKR